MKKQKKVLAILLCMVLVVLTGCKTSEEEKKPDSSKTEQNNQNQNDTQKEQITLTYASWALGTEEDNNLETILMRNFLPLDTSLQYPHF